MAEGTCVISTTNDCHSAWAEQCPIVYQITFKYFNIKEAYLQFMHGRSKTLKYFGKYCLLFPTSFSFILNLIKLYVYFFLLTLYRLKSQWRNDLFSLQKVGLYSSYTFSIITQTIAMNFLYSRFRNLDHEQFSRIFPIIC